MTLTAWKRLCFFFFEFSKVRLIEYWLLSSSFHIFEVITRNESSPLMKATSNMKNFLALSMILSVNLRHNLRFIIFCNFRLLKIGLIELKSNTKLLWMRKYWLSAIYSCMFQTFVLLSRANNKRLNRGITCKHLFTLHKNLIQVYCRIHCRYFRMYNKNQIFIFWQIIQFVPRTNTQIDLSIRNLNWKSRINVFIRIPSCDCSNELYWKCMHNFDYYAFWSCTAAINCVLFVPGFD